ncbi:bile acid:sodium symporter family protein [Aestuariivivens sediminis]|uniref:bile acid:sodium symporter family protein n=1 Tax=Aestuariivivens sediminis TaxID=2913557 RepID=UPI001F587FBE|nr:bile acid:sodium symporter family protein [Aestuariivivens sediminis]
MKSKLILVVLFVFLITTVYQLFIGSIQNAGIPMLGLFIVLALYGYVHKRLKSMSFTFWVFAFLIAAMYYPFLFTDWGFNTKILVIPMLQLIMFGMGTKLSFGDFKEELSKPKGVITGTVMAFGIMPLLGVFVVKLFNFPPDIAIGVILIGCCPGGASSNVMAFLAKGNVALSVSVTTVTTLVTPIVTPALMKLLANEMIEISFIKMMLSSFNLIIVPIAAGLICNKILYGNSDWIKKKHNVLTVAILAGLMVFLILAVPFLTSLTVIKPGLILGLSLISIVSLTKLIVKYFNGPQNWMDKILPSLSMFSIVLFVTIVVALNRDKLLVVGLFLVAASAIHNLFGFILGYSCSRLVGLSKRDSRTLSIEVALKNGGLGMGLALEALGSANAALAPIVFGKWMNISGSALANYWRVKRVDDEE